MKVLLLNGSPHEKGCTYTALDQVARALTEEGLKDMIDRAAARAGDKQAQAEAVRKLRELERGNTDAARRLLS